MTLLSLENVSRRYRSAAREGNVLHDVSLELDRGELVSVWGVKRSGRSTLLRLAAGIETPDTGVVRFRESDLAGNAGALGRGIGYCKRTPGETEAREVLDELMVAQLARGIPQRFARTRAFEALERVGSARCGAETIRELDSAETARVMLARALVLEPSLLLLDEPTAGVDLLERDGILSLLRSLTDEGIAVLMSTGEATELAGADRALSLTGGTLRGSVAPELAAVVPLRRASA